MVCSRCKMVVKDELTKLGLRCTSVELGEVEILGDISISQWNQIYSALLGSGLELMEDKKNILIQKIKNVIIDVVHNPHEHLPVKLSGHLSQKLNQEYTFLANLFSEVQGCTIEKFYITRKIERVKELLLRNDFTLTEIAYNMQYSSVAHLSAQFKKVTGITPSHFKQLNGPRHA